MGSWRFHNETECIRRIIKFDSKEKKDSINETNIKPFNFILPELIEY
jgi:hypothetical protein